MSIDEARHVLLDAGYRVYDPPERPPEECSVCGRDMDDDYLIDFEVTVASGEEGYSNVRLYRCDEHSAELMDALVDLGFTTHDHGGISYLENRRCPGALAMLECETPTDAEVIITHGGVWSTE